ncbi:hypothetical protein EG329_005985 [Mollisiaceae sp. DMI_Dod_QoI]|nr:hypothetical protein EG329_005985 [Helotiales sp. DMI_Dod_QoI]
MEEHPWQEHQEHQPNQPDQGEAAYSDQPPRPEHPEHRGPPSPGSSVRSWPTSEYSNINAPSIRSARTVSTQWPRPEQQPFLARQTSNTSTQRVVAEEAPSTVTLIGRQTPGEKDFEQMIQSRMTPGQRVALQPPRGVLSGPGPGAEQYVGDAVEAVIAYHFHNRDLLLEALESPGSGIVCVGEGKRQIPNGNKELANLGKAVMELALMEQFYQFQIPECKNSPVDNMRKAVMSTRILVDLDMLTETAEHMRLLNVIGRRNLAKIGEHSEIQRWIRPRMALPPSQQRSLFRLLKQDLQTVTRQDDPSSTIARAMRALIGAVYLDGGILAVDKVMMELRLLIRQERSTEQHAVLKRVCEQ